MANFENGQMYNQNQVFFGKTFNMSNVQTINVSDPNLFSCSRIIGYTATAIEGDVAPISILGFFAANYSITDSPAVPTFNESYVQVNINNAPIPTNVNYTLYWINPTFKNFNPV